MNIKFGGNRELPDTLKTTSGETVDTAQQWMDQRRPEILELFKEYVYGREPVTRPTVLNFLQNHPDPAMDGSAIRKRVEIVYEGPGGKGQIQLLLFVPAKRKGPFPAFVLMNNRGEEHMDADRKIQSEFWPAELLVSRGYAAAVFNAQDVDPDHHDGFRNGVHGVLEPEAERRTPSSWGTIAAWAWGASRVMDYLEQDPDIDSSRVALAGHSRCGKAALWAGALDQRFAMVVSNNSGSTGAAVSRGKNGERIRNINDVFPHWFNENYKAFNDCEFDLPVDQHMLLALIAPRSVYVTSATEDGWADPESEWISVLHASPVYRLLGKPGISLSQMPEPESPIHVEGMGYHLRTGGHDLKQYDWQQFLDYADRYLERG